MSFVDHFLCRLRIGPVADKTGNIMIILSVHLSLLLDFKCQFPTFGLLLYICGLYSIIIIIIISSSSSSSSSSNSSSSSSSSSSSITHGVSIYFTYCGRGKMNLNWILKNQLVNPQTEIS